ncbi:acyl-ACP--UDP-N-acetylglucosamine O-acyltransferase [Meiothermus taiwanensis]|uniref:Acyl-[acyl-carrier-protein]--UDP-N-acetylglucosamine O-acyltransferase n=2 Tax=Meiothermus taiwanensis TaxID=172827 RepID=A0A399EB30_9DEIN|nr:acyl-ACP--UDP-N-acetylglucosamine O-acyltransferase [Meiothermus taiwanensis]AWR87594.1 acyl-(acyl-carrier-protein)--UDP-N- acetylglucosamine O-acyltransferase [Meiothermus taiwanensis WR-220]KIQ54580.1 UDP-N-acetylglucosamine acyltransferase [Meiothermus taiwanensis]KZK16745.1 acyl-[acyl-carrier-protein]--UDP-N-acetylglucosamine O-acyltransferase [Meiothermus taiwanensis]RIH79302.1 Acyl-[acyl-carrier-protein]--UDP-N-acetylglucosamine O-acyltransferase [Meiothermus taiwanensis]
MSRVAIHPTAVVSPKAHLAPDVKIGPYAVVEGPCEIGPGVEVGPHAVIHPYVRLAAGVRVGPHAVLGGIPQDLSFKGQETWLEVGENTVLREGVILHRSTKEEVPTRIGAGCYLMGHSHVGHDAQVGNGVILTQGVGVAGHVEIGDYAVIGGMAGIHQFVRVGSRAMIGGLAKVTRDVLPFSLADGSPALHYRLNTVGLRRAGITGERYRALEQAFRAVREGRPLEGLPDTEEVRALKAFLASPSRRHLAGFVRGEPDFEG